MISPVGADALPGFVLPKRELNPTTPFAREEKGIGLAPEDLLKILPGIAMGFLWKKL